LVGVLFFLIFPKKGTTTAAIMIFAFAQMVILNFNMIPLPQFGEMAPASFFPIVAGTNAISNAGDKLFRFVDPDLAWEGGIELLGTDMSSAYAHVGILAGLTIAVLIAVIIVGRKRKI